ncbi:MAG: pentapeptide repeat-containing protein, partial [Verrucomicrobiota bacterium]
MLQILLAESTLIRMWEITDQQLKDHSEWLKSKGQSGVRLDKTGRDLSNSAHPGAKMDQGKFIGARFNNANLEGASFAEADFSGARLEGANLKGVNFRGADLG